MTIKTLTAGLLLIALFFNSTPVLARQTSGAAGDWAAVKSLDVGEKLRVQLRDGKKFEGRLSGVSDTTLTLERNNKPTELSRDSISRVDRLVGRAGKSIGKAAAIGAAVGGGVGAVAGLASGGYEDLGPGDIGLILGAVGAGIGAGVGALVGSLGSKQKRVLVYESR
ncbi:MAG TPA: hypothetical protein VNA19_13125 [Pyrinomonadaceae bacterium]|jgi:hypothetical protein|nr:hypothetical protein [Pyrinomonadaceae bacterium]